MSSGSGNFFSRLGNRIERFSQRVTEGLKLSVLWSQFVAEARASYSLYARELDWDALGRESRFKGLLKAVSALFWARRPRSAPRSWPQGSAMHSLPSPLNPLPAGRPGGVA